ncbi:MAG: cupredoxin domain-containing protein [Solirubrobacteraceae bacterium]
MQSRTSRRALAAAALGVVLAMAGTALAAGGGPSRATVVIKGGESFKTNAYIKSSLHFAAGTVRVRSGATVTLLNTTGDPHTLSIVSPSQLPRTIGQVESCKVCKSIAKAHGVNPSEESSGPPPHPLVNAGPAGFDQPGDSIIISPKGPHGKVTFKITAKPGTTLHFMCAIHPWMQGRFVVVK